MTSWNKEHLITCSPRFTGSLWTCRTMMAEWWTVLWTFPLFITKQNNTNCWQFVIAIKWEKSYGLLSADPFFFFCSLREYKTCIWIPINIIVKREIWIFKHCFGLGSETMRYVYCFIVFLPICVTSRLHCETCHDGPLTRYVKLRVAHAPGIPGTFSQPLRVSDPDMHYGTCLTHVPWCMQGSLTIGFL